MSIISLQVCSVYTVYLPIPSSLLFTSPCHHSLSLFPLPSFLSHPALFSPGKMERRRVRGRERGEKDHCERRDSREKSDSSLWRSGWGLFSFSFSISLSPLTYSTHRNCRLLRSSLSCCGSLRVPGFSHAQLRYACQCLTMAIRTYTHTHAHQRPFSHTDSHKPAGKQEYSLTGNTLRNTVHSPWRQTYMEMRMVICKTGHSATCYCKTDILLLSCL